MSALVLTYHGIDARPAPLFVDPRLFEAHVECIVESGVAVLTIGALVSALRAGELPVRAVAITFDDGFESAVKEAAPRLLGRGLSATIFCVAARLGGVNGWPSQSAWVPRRALARASDLAELVGAGFEIGSHGMTHAPLHRQTREGAVNEVRDSRRVLEDAVGAPVSSFAYPYGVLPSEEVRVLVEETYAAACASAIGVVQAHADQHALPRVDAHYLRRPALLRRALGGELGIYLRARRAGARARRAVVRDFADARRR